MPNDREQKERQKNQAQRGKYRKTPNENENAPKEKSGQNHFVRQSKRIHQTPQYMGDYYVSNRESHILNSSDCDRFSQSSSQGTPDGTNKVSGDWASCGSSGRKFFRMTSLGNSQLSSERIALKIRIYKRRKE